VSRAAGDCGNRSPERGRSVPFLAEPHRIVEGVRVDRHRLLLKPAATNTLVSITTPFMQSPCYEQSMWETKGSR